MIVHFTDSYLLSPPHKITVDLIGMGGTGSQVITNLGRLNMALLAYSHPGLHVRCWDDDIVTEANIGRQLFSAADLGLNKAIVLVSRLNTFYGFDWEARPQRFTKREGLSNITITCVDTAAGRIEIGHILTESKQSKDPSDRAIYWLDLGNLQKTGQVILGTVHNIHQPKSEKVKTGTLSTVVKKFPQLKRIKEVDQGPSCSLVEAINKQDLFINSILAQFGVNLLWKLFREGMITYHGCYVNLQNFIVNPIKL